MSDGLAATNDSFLCGGETIQSCTDARLLAQSSSKRGRHHPPIYSDLPSLPASHVIANSDTNYPLVLQGPQKQRDCLFPLIRSYPWDNMEPSIFVFKEGEMDN